ncbi:MAG: hypothetical protein ABI164_07770 [Acidobacteriaceae bacterium]
MTKSFAAAAILVAAISLSLLFATGCGANALNSLGNPPVVSAQQNYSSASLSGTYSFNEEGFNGVIRHDGSGTLQFDGSGNVAGTITDYYIGSNSCQFTIAGTYSIASSAKGTAALTTTSTDSNCIGSTGTINLQLGQQGQSFVFAESDGLRLDTGTALRQ